MSVTERSAGPCYIAVDGGGSKTLAVVVGAHGRECGRGHAGGSNFRAIGLERAPAYAEAADAMLPFAAQGAAMAIEDAAVLAKALSDGPTETAANVTAAFMRYARARRRQRAAETRSCSEEEG